MLYLTAECKCGWARHLTVEAHERITATRALESAAAVHEDTNVRRAYRHETSVRAEGGR